MESVIADIQSWLANPQLVNELLITGGLLLVAWLVAHILRKRFLAASSFGAFSQLLFPLIGLLLLGTMHFVAYHFHGRQYFAAIVMQLLWAMAGIRMLFFALQRGFPQSLWVSAFGRSIAALVWMIVALSLIGILPELLQWLDSFELPLGKSHISLLGVLQGLAAVVSSLLLALWLGGLIEARLMQVSGLDSSVKAVLTRASKAFLSLLAILVGMELVGLDLTALSVFSGALGVGLGFGMQKIASNYVSGFIILLDRSIQIGNLIQVGAERGEVLHITTRYTVLRALTGAHFIVPNETLVGTVVQNDSFADPRTRGSVQVQVAYGTDVERVLCLLAELPKAEARVIQNPAPESYLVSFDASGITLELGFWILDPGNGMLGLKSNINRAILRRFREEGIHIPFPQHEVRILAAS